MLKIHNLHARVAEKNVLQGVNLEIPKAEIHVLMGPNGVGKSTLGHVLMARENYDIEEGSIALDGEELNHLDTSARAKKGLFLAFQSPVAIPGLKVSELLRNLYNIRHTEQLNVAKFRRFLKPWLEALNMDRGFLSRYLNEGFSGGEMKRLEMLQLVCSQPKVAILDEIDSGVDVDAQRIVGEAIGKIREQFGTSFLIITHYQRLLKFVQADKVHIVLEGKIAQSGGLDLVDTLESRGYEAFKPQAVSDIQT